MPVFSVIIPVYNRPEELDILLTSLSKQSFRDFEVIIVEDGSTKDARSVYEKFSGTLDIKYYHKQNSGPGPSRNMGFEHASGAYMVMFDSDCILPYNYFEIVLSHLKAHPLDAWGGPDRSHSTFSPRQQAMAITMSSVLTTGGIRGGKNQSENFQPRSFNMGFSREVYKNTGGFKFTRLAEDIELSMRMKKAGFKVGLIADAFLYHQRRTTFGQFFKQVRNFGKGRVLVGREHPEAIRIAHWFPTFFLLGLVALIPGLVFATVPALVVGSFYGLYLLAIAVDGYRKSGSALVAVLCIPAALVQLCGYGWGFLQEQFRGR